MSTADQDHNGSCPAWFERNSNGYCRCARNIEPGFVICNSTNNITLLSNQWCVTYDDINDTVYAGACPYNTLPVNTTLNSLPVLQPWTNTSQLNKAMCDPLNRTGLLCSKCQEGLGPAVLSYTKICVKCFNSGYGWLVYLTAALLPTTILCIVVVTFQFDATSPSMNTFILMCQVSSTAITFSFHSVFKNTLIFDNQTYTASQYYILALISFYGMWNLEFFRSVLPPFCISSDMNTLQALALNYVVALYPLILTAVVYYCIEFHDKGYRVLVFLWKPFHRHFVRFRRKWNVKGSVINAFATFVLLSYSQLLNVSYGLLLPVIVYNSNGGTLNRPVMFIDTSVTLFDRSHLPYAILSIAVLVFFILIPLVYILFYQNRIFKKCLATCKLENALLSELVKIFQKSYNNGIDGSYDLRWFAGVNLILRGIFTFIAFPVNRNPEIAVYFSLQLTFVASGLTALLCAILRPHQKMVFNIIDTIFYAVICYSVVYLTIAGTAPVSFIPLAIVFWLPSAYFVCLVTYNLIQKFKSMECSQKLFEIAKSVCCRRKTQEQDDELEGTPDRLVNSSEYTPLLPPGEPITVTSISVLND